MLNLDKNKTYLLACSYGPDSMALFSMLFHEGYDFDVAFVNYHFRKESDEEERGLIEYCFKTYTKYFIYDNKEKVEKNLEARAREIRYHFFGSLYYNHGYAGLLVAHNQDDVIETYIMQKRRKLHPFCFGIQEYSLSYGMNVIRPLLDYSKKDLLDYCNENDVPYMIDASNLELVHERNVIRHTIVAKMSHDERENILKEIELKNQEISSILSHLKTVDLHSCKTYINLNDIEKIYAIQLIANECQIFKISEANRREVLKIISSKKPNVLLPYSSYYFVKEYDHIYFARIDGQIRYSYTLNEPGVLDTPYFYLDFTHGSSDRNVKDDDYPITIRVANPYDLIRIKDYQKECRRLFIDWKMPVLLRKRWPLIENKNGKIVYMPRYQKDFKVCKNLNFYVK